MPDNIKRMNIREFRAEGFLQEANRVFFHPLGLALEVNVEDDGTETLGGIWDYRDDPEGVAFGPGVIDPENIQKVEAERQRHHGARHKMFRTGSTIQGPDDNYA